MTSDDPLLSELDDRIDAQRRHPVDPPPNVRRPGATAPTPGAASWGRRAQPSTAPAEPRPAEIATRQADGSALGTAALMHYLDAEFELSRRRTDDGIDRVLEALTAIDGRLAELESFREGLFTWLDSYVQWEATTLTVINDHIRAAVASWEAQRGTEPPTQDPAST